MQIKKAYRYRLVPTEGQRSAFERYSGACRFVWNLFCSQREAWYQSGASLIAEDERDISVNPNNYVRQSNQLPALKACYPWLKEVPSQCLQQTLMQLDRAYKDFFQGHKGYPQYHKRGSHDSFRLPDPKGFRIDEHKQLIQLPKVGWVKLRLSRGIKGLAKNVTVSRRGKNWYASIQVEEDLILAKAPQVPVGIDLGVTDTVSLSDGQHFSGIDFAKLEKKRLRYQRQLSRKRKGSENWKKAKDRLSRVNERIVDKRKDHLHKLSTTISKNHAMIVVENLCVKRMSASARGSLDKPGKSVKQKASLNRSILRQGWGEFVRQLEYKVSWREGLLIKISPEYTSQRCHLCGHTESQNRKGKMFRCLACGHREDADTQAAKNILAAGHAVTACGGSVSRRPMKQEPECVAKRTYLKIA